MSDDYERGEAIEMMEDETARLEADNARLRALIKDAEWSNYRNDESQRPFCPWCGKQASASGKHADDCPAFTPDGEVK